MTKQGKVLLMTPNLKGIKGGVNRIQPSLGIGYLAAVLLRDGHEVHVRDTALEGYDNQVPLEDGRTLVIGQSDKEIADYVVDIGPDIVGISVLFSNLAGHAHDIARIVKEVKPDAYVIVGGNHISNAAKDYAYARIKGNKGSVLEQTLIQEMLDANIDYAMSGEADFEFAKLVDRLLNVQEPIDVKNLFYRENGGIEFTSPPPTRIDKRFGLENLPHPARHLFDMEHYFSVDAFHSAQSSSDRVLNVMASRGCPEVCTFCTTPDMWGSKVRWRNPQDIIKEIKDGVEAYKIGEIQFEDDTLTANYRLLTELCDLLEPLGVPWCTPNGTKVNYHMRLQPEMYRRMKESGCYQITLACETGVQRVMDEVIGKKLNVDQIKPAIENAKKAGMFVHTFWIAGYPGETREEMGETIRFAAESGADSYSVSILSPLPGTPIYRQVIEQNLWWPEVRGIQDMTYRTSLVRVDGFSGPKEFERWVEQQNRYLRGLLEQRDPTRAAAYSGISSARNLDAEQRKLKQT